MLANSDLTIYHKTTDPISLLEKWERHHYYKVWWFGGKGASIDKGYQNANDVQIRIPYNENVVNIKKIAIGDILVQGIVEREIQTQQDLKDYQVYNVTTVKNNKFGSNPHVHIGGK